MLGGLCLCRLFVGQEYGTLSDFLVGASVLGSANVSSSLPWVLALNPLNSSAPLVDGTGAAWAATPIRVLQGFNCSFVFQQPRVPPTYYAQQGEGFAFVLQWDGAGLQARGEGAAQLGYNLNHSLAVEIDLYTNTPTGFSDTAAIPHVELHTGWNTSRNSASNERKLPTRVGALVQAAPTVVDAFNHTCRVVYIPESSVSAGSGTMRVWLDDTLVADVRLSAANMSATFPLGVAFVGFTSSAATNRWAQIVILDFKIATVPVDPLLSHVVAPNSAYSASVGNASAPANLTDYTGLTRTQVVLTDACGVDLAYPSPYVRARLAYPDGALSPLPASSSRAVVTNSTAPAGVAGATATYDVRWVTQTAVAPSSAYKLVIEYAATMAAAATASSGWVLLGGAGAAAGLNVTVYPGQPDLLQSFTTPASFGSVFSANALGGVVVGSNVTASLSLRDAWGNTASLPGSWGVWTRFSGALVNATLVSAAAPSEYTLTFVAPTTVLDLAIARIYLGTSSLFPNYWKSKLGILVLAGPVYPPYCTISLPSRPIANTLNTIPLTLQVGLQRERPC